MKRFLLILSLAGIVSACVDSDVYENVIEEDNNKIVLSEEELISISYDNPENLTEDEVLAYVTSFIDGLGVMTRSSSEVTATIADSYEVRFPTKTLTRSGLCESVKFYNVALKSSKSDGYAIVSADERSAGVIAYIENGDFTKKNETGAHMMLQLSEATVITEIERIEKIRQELRNQTLEKLSKITGVQNVSYLDIKDRLTTKGSSKITRSVAYDTPLTQVVSMMPTTGPVLNIEWSQDYPYNMLLGVCYDPLFHMETHYPAGCGIIAGAQTLAAIEPNITIDGVSIDWDFLKENPTVEYYPYFGGELEKAEMVATLIKDMYDETGTTPNIDEDFIYDTWDDPDIPCVKSSSTSVSALRDYLNQYISCGTYYNRYAPDPLLTTINANRQMPCVAIMGGVHAANETAEKGSHAWIIDGYVTCVKSTREILQNYDLYFHANMGWGGTDNGYYKVNADTSTDFETNVGTYNTNFWEITQIHRK